MISNQVLQSTIDGIKEISRVELAVMEAEGREVASTAPLFEEAAEAVAGFAQSQADSQEVGDFQFFKVFDENQLEFVLVLKGASDHSLMVGRMAAFQIKGLLNASKERYDKDSFIKNLLLDNLLLVDIYGRSKKLHIPAEAPRVAVLIEVAPTEEEAGVLELMQAYVSGTSDFVTSLDENSAVVVRELGDSSAQKDISKAAGVYEKYLERSGMKGIRIAYGTVVEELKEVSRSYKEAKMALDVSKIFFEDRTVVAYNELGIGRLIYQLPIPLCRMFISEIFKGMNPDEFDDETITTINKFFENSLNVSETSRQLFIHRNTLVYRLDKLLKMTGLDLRVFEDAITFKIALMVVKYMKYMESYEY
ncbi:MAG: helix-turn-helix domain-containing protein [Eubacteriales bacterium]|nr:helix-turn-helix domain-containing protein [Eubacteriales bacterium]